MDTSLRSSSFAEGLIPAAIQLPESEGVKGMREKEKREKRKEERNGRGEKERKGEGEVTDSHEDQSKKGHCIFRVSSPLWPWKPNSPRNLDRGDTCDLCISTASDKRLSIALVSTLKYSSPSPSSSLVSSSPDPNVGPFVGAFVAANINEIDFCFLIEAALWSVDPPSKRVSNDWNERWLLGPANLVGRVELKKFVLYLSNIASSVSLKKSTPVMVSKLESWG